MLNGICMPGVVPPEFARVAPSVTVIVVTAVSQLQVAPAVQLIVAVVPSWSWIEMVPVPPFIFSLKVTENESPVSTKSVLGPALLTIRASIIVGGVKSAAPVVKVTLVGFARSLPAMSWISFASGVSVRVYVVADGRAVFVVTENDESAVTWLAA